MWIAIVCLIAAPVIIVVAVLSVDLIAGKVKWRPFKNYFLHAEKNAEPDAFLMTMPFYIEAWALIGIIVFSLTSLWGIAGGMFLCRQSFWSGLWIGMGITLPSSLLIVVCVHFFTKRIVFFKDRIIIRSAFIIKRINRLRISSVEEEKNSDERALVVRYENKVLTLSDKYGNYDLAVKYFLDKKILKRWYIG